ncbi:aminotransferase class V [Gemmatirosa kalamazoonensis]|uniref:Aminotransferase class V n=2 Tax=Gemmatirosa kalamazoonensis TaxID=861299 RepID=W0RFB7_9BACT|nr:aminotransferase class V [Gemmatirosa kalamazoonensis]
MNNCSQAPQTLATRAAAERYLDSWAGRGMDWDAWMEEVRLAKAAFARLVGASPDEIAICSSVSEAANLIASALDFGDDRRELVVSEAEFPTVGHVWLAQRGRGAEVRWVPVQGGAVALDDYATAVTERTRLVSACHGYYQNGVVQDVARIANVAHERGALLFVDAYQTAGAVPIDVRALDVDFLAAGNLKYLMGVPGVAFLYVRRELIERLEPTMTGWFGRADPFAFRVSELDWSPTASRFDLGTPPIPSAYVARAGMELVIAVGVERIRAWHETLARRLLDGGRARGLTVHGPDDVRHKTASTAFVVRDAHAVEVAMRARGVLPSARGPVIRLAPHYYSTLDDVDAALDVLVDVID